MSRPKIVPSQVSKFELFVRHGLSERQALIADMVRHGFKHKEVADELGMSENGVSENCKQSLRILGLGTRGDLVRLWRNGER